MFEHPLALAAIVAAFALFTVVLAYVDRIAARRPDAEPAE
jgi:hypothetical protein